jgi:serine/threonine protein kinase
MFLIFKHQKSTIFALKKFNPSKDAGTFFHRERLLLEELRRRPHDHVVVHLTSFMHRRTFYILFPLAQCDLRAFLNRTTVPPLYGDIVLWFFSQLKGLAEAVLHLHTLGEPTIERQWSSDHEFMSPCAVLHGDIKPENILVFDSPGEASLGTFKLSDFGSARTSGELQRHSPHGEIHPRGTEAYQAPDLMDSSEISCVTDVWSLGCVFLELLVWLFYPPGSEEIGFMTQRSTDTLSHSSSFWKLTNAGRIDLKSGVRRRLLDLEYTPCCGKLALEYLLQHIWLIFLPHRDEKPYSALRLCHDIDACTSQAELDLTQNPNHFLDPTVRSWQAARPWPSWKSGIPPPMDDPTVAQQQRWYFEQNTGSAPERRRKGLKNFHRRFALLNDLKSKTS